GLFGEFELPLRGLEIGDVVKGYHDPSICNFRPVYLFRRCDQTALTDGWQISGEFAMHAASRSILQPLEEFSKCADVEMMCIGIMQPTPQRVSSRGAEKTKEPTVRRHDPQVLVEHDERLMDRIDHRLGVA